MSAKNEPLRKLIRAARKVHATPVDNDRFLQLLIPKKSA